MSERSGRESIISAQHAKYQIAFFGQFMYDVFKFVSIHNLKEVCRNFCRGQPFSRHMMTGLEKQNVN
jgi:hypothetical protein